MTSKKELIVVVPNGYQPVNSRWYPKSPGRKQEKNTIHKSGSSNLLVEKTKSVDKLIIFVFSFALKVVLPNSKIWVSEKSVLSNSVRSMLTKLFRSVRRPLQETKKRQETAEAKVNSRFICSNRKTY